ncbi:MAG: galactokinase [Oscillospiraceae bacterium]|nr:galactokinase [Oscillospiraceae bacterium]
MTTTRELREQIQKGEFDRTFTKLYPDVTAARERYIDAISAFENRWGERMAVLISAPGRTELGGNHTDHQHGRVLAAAVDSDVICVASPNNGNVITLESKGHKPDVIELSDLIPRDEEKNHGGALIRGVTAWFNNNGYIIGGFDAYTTSDILKGSGLSSSAAFEVAVGNILNYLYNGGKVSPKEIAIAGKYAENEFFGKPSGLMDQMASSVGGFICIDFLDTTVTPIDFDFSSSGYTLCVVDTKGSHADLTADYAAIPLEMRAVAEFFGKQYLRDVDERAFRDKIAEIRAAAGDRAVLRAMHFFADNERVEKQAAALSGGSFEEYLRLVIESGRSSFMCLQNIYAGEREQGLAVALALSERVLSGRGGAWRVHGGGFAGTVQAYVPNGILDEYRAEIEKVFGDGTCRGLKIRSVGGTRVSAG